MNRQIANQIHQQKPSATPAASGLLQRKCACGTHTVAGGECAECKKNQTLQRASLSPRGSGVEGGREVPPIVHEVLRSPGKSLDAATRAFMEPRFGHDFSQVRIHDDAQAGASAREVNALAYTVGSHLVFNSGVYAPHTASGKGLLAHELTHVVQQRQGPATLSPLTLDKPGEGAQEQEAERVRDAIESDSPIGRIGASSAPIVQRLPGSPAGGCGVCYGTPKNAGIAAHVLIQAAFNPLVSTEFPLLPSPSDENGRLDLARFTDPDSVQIGEIKPANPAGLIEGDLDLFWYEEQLTKLGFKVSRMVLPPPVAALDFPSLAPPPCPSTQKLFVDPPAHGIYTYWCMPDFSQLIGQCPCLKGPPPIPVPERAKEKVSEKKKVREKDPEKIRVPRPDILVPVALAALLGWAIKQAAKQGAKRILAPAYVIAAIVLIANGAEASVGLEGDDALEAMFKAAADKGTPIPEDLKQAIKNDPTLKQIALDAAKSGGGEAQRKLGEELARVITENRDQFTEEEIKELLKVSEENRDVVPNAPVTVEILKRALEAKQKGVTAKKGGGTGGGSGKTTDKTDTTDTEGGQKDDTPSAPLPPTISPPERLVAGLAQAGAGGPKFSAKVKDRLLAVARAANPPLTDDEVTKLLEKVGSAEGKTEDEIVASVERGIGEVRKQKTAAEGQPGDADATKDQPPTPNTGPKIEVDKPDPNKKVTKGERDIIAEYDKVIDKFEWVEVGTFLVMNEPPYETGKTYSMWLLGRDSGKILYVGSVRVTIVSKGTDTWKVTIAGGSTLYTKGAIYGAMRAVTDNVVPPDIAKGGGKKK